MEIKRDDPARRKSKRWESASGWPPAGHQALPACRPCTLDVLACTHRPCQGAARACTGLRTASRPGRGSCFRVRRRGGLRCSTRWERRIRREGRSPPSGSETPIPGCWRARQSSASCRCAHCASASRCRTSRKAPARFDAP